MAFIYRKGQPKPSHPKAKNLKVGDYFKILPNQYLNAEKFTFLCVEHESSLNFATAVSLEDAAFWNLDHDWDLEILKPGEEFTVVVS